MAELLPEVQLFGEESKPGSRKHTVTDILTWIQCFGTYISVLGPGHPECIPKLMAYMQEIVRASQRFQGRAWVCYDATFRRQAAASGNRRWSEINGTLHHACYSGESQTGLRCELCMSFSHRTSECMLAGTDTKDTSPSSASPRGPGNWSSRPGWRYLPPSGEVCRSWNQDRCRFPQCRHTHVCAQCGGSHPATVCQRAQGSRGPGSRGRGQGWPGAH